MTNVSDWSTTDASNNSSPPAGAPEGMAPSAVNDTMRTMMGAVARWYGDTNGALSITAATSNAFTLTSNRSLSAYAAGQVFMAHAGSANTGDATLNIDGVGAKSIRKHGNITLTSSDIIAGSLYLFAYSADDDVFQLLTLPSREFGAGTLDGTTLSAVTLVDSVIGTLSGGTIQSPTITTPVVNGGSLSAVTVAGASTLTGGTIINAASISAATIVGGTLTGGTVINAATLSAVTIAGASTLTGGTVINSPSLSGGVLTAPHIDGGTISGATLVDVSGLGDLVFLQETDVAGSAVATVDFLSAFDSTYDDYLIICSGVSFASDNDRLTIRLEFDGAGSFETGSNYFFSYIESGGGTVASTENSGTSIILAGGVTGNDAQDGLSVTIWVYNVNRTSAPNAQILFQGTTYGVGAGEYTSFLGGGGFADNTGALTGIQFDATGNIDDGVFRIYGIRNS